MEKVVAHGVTLRQFTFGKVGRIEVAHYQPRIVAPADEPIHLSMIDL